MVFGRKLRGPRADWTRLDVHSSPAAMHPVQGEVSEHLTWRIRHGSQARRATFCREIDMALPNVPVLWAVRVRHGRRTQSELREALTPLVVADWGTD